MDPAVGIVILNAFNSENLIECLNSLKNTIYDNYKIYVVSCLNPTLKDVKKEFSYVNFIEIEEDVGPSEMHNHAYRAASNNEKYFVSLDDDTTTDPNWLKELVSLMEKDEKVGIAQSKILLYNEKDKYNTYGNKANFLAVGWAEGFGEKVDKKHDYEKDIDFPAGCGMILRSDALKKIDYFDKDYFIYGDDMDVGFRILLAGYKLKYCPKSIVYHKYAFLKSKRTYYYLNQNRLLSYLKLYKIPTYIFQFPAQLFYEFFMLGYGIRNGYPIELFKSYLYIIKNIGRIKEKRKKIKTYKRVSDREIIKRFSDQIKFKEADKYFPVKFILNPYLYIYKKFLLVLIWW